MWQRGGLTRQISCGLDTSPSVAGLLVHYIHQVLEGGHLLPQRGGGLQGEGLEDEEAEKHKVICSVIRLDSPEFKNDWGAFMERQRRWTPLD